MILDSRCLLIKNKQTRQAQMLTVQIVYTSIITMINFIRYVCVLNVERIFLRFVTAQIHFVIKAVG